MSAPGRQPGHQAHGAAWSGVSPYNAPAGQGRWSVGTGTVYCYGCNL